MNGMLRMQNADSAALDDVSRMTVEEFREAVISATEGGARAWPPCSAIRPARA